MRVDINYSHHDYPPVTVTGVGAVLHLEDILLGKLQASTSRTAERDFFDIDALLLTGRWTVHDLWAKLRSAKPSWTAERFADVLASVRAGDPVECQALGMSARQVDDMFTRLEGHAEILRNAHA